MSCHDIGRGMNEVVRHVISLYDSDRIGLKETKTIIATCAAAVHWCDGNGPEAFDYIEGCRCGKCLRMVPEGEKLYGLGQLYRVLNYDQFMTKHQTIYGLRVCSECFDSIMEAEEKISDSGAELRRKTEDSMSHNPGRLLSTGSHAATNNGCTWVRDVDWAG